MADGRERGIKAEYYTLVYDSLPSNDKEAVEAEEGESVPLCVVEDDDETAAAMDDAVVNVVDDTKVVPLRESLLVVDTCSDVGLVGPFENVT